MDQINGFDMLEKHLKQSGSHISLSLLNVIHEPIECYILDGGVPDPGQRLNYNYTMSLWFMHF